MNVHKATPLKKEIVSIEIGGFKEIPMSAQFNGNTTGKLLKLC